MTLWKRAGATLTKVVVTTLDRRDGRITSADTASPEAVAADRGRPRGVVGAPHPELAVAADIGAGVGFGTVGDENRDAALLWTWRRRSNGSSSRRVCPFASGFVEEAGRRTVRWVEAVSTHIRLPWDARRRPKTVHVDVMKESVVGS